MKNKSKAQNYVSERQAALNKKFGPLAPRLRLLDGDPTEADYKLGVHNVIDTQDGVVGQFVKEARTR